MTAVTRETGAAEPLRSALRKARWRLIPLLSVCYLIAFMDRANISFASATMNRDLHFTPKIYGLGAGLFFLSYAACEIPSNRLLLRFGARRWLARIMLTWGLLAAAMVFIRTPWSFYSLRLLLGVAEAGYFPGALFYLSQWFPAAERARSISLFYIALPLSSTVMGGVAGVLLRQNGRLGLTGWQWLFLVEALPAIALSFVVWFCLPESPATARWLTEPEREALDTELANDPVRRRDAASGTAGSGLRRALHSGPAWTISLFLFLTLGSYYAIIFSLPVVLGELTGWDAGRVGYLVAGGGITGAVAMILVARSSDRQREWRWHIVVPAALMALAVLVAGLHLVGWVAAVALLLALAAYNGMQGPLMGLPNRILSGEAAAVAIAMLTMCGVTGGFLGPYWMGWMREATGGYAVGIGALCLPCLLGVVCMLRLMRHIEPKRVDAGEGNS
jgi:ACS family tartrate transporter-like MFS transporter